jgi:hypothetical protein
VLQLLPAVAVHDKYHVPFFDQETSEFVAKYTDLPPMEEWKLELMGAAFRDRFDDRESFRDLDNDSESVREGLQRWLCSSGTPHQAAASDGGNDAVSPCL